MKITPNWKYPVEGSGIVDRKSIRLHTDLCTWADYFQRSPEKISASLMETTAKLHGREKVHADVPFTFSTHRTDLIRFSLYRKTVRGRILIFLLPFGANKGIDCPIKIWFGGGKCFFCRSAQPSRFLLVERLTSFHLGKIVPRRVDLLLCLFATRMFCYLFVFVICYHLSGVANFDFEQVGVSFSWLPFVFLLRRSPYCLSPANEVYVPKVINCTNKI